VGSEGEGFKISGSLIIIVAGGLKMETCEIKDIISDGGNGAAINGVIKNSYVLRVMDSTFNNCTAIGSASMGGAIFAVVETGGKLIISGKKSDSQFTFMRCVAGSGGALAVSFNDGVNNDNGLFLDGMIILYILFVLNFSFLCLLIIRFSFI
jgi:hypothetical protein